MMSVLDDVVAGRITPEEAAEMLLDREINARHRRHAAVRVCLVASAVVLVVLGLTLLLTGCASPEPQQHAVLTAAPETAVEACAPSCAVLASHGCEPEHCEDSCRRLAALGYVWPTSRSGPLCISHATTLAGVRACNARCEGGR